MQLECSSFLSSTVHGSPPVHTLLPPLSWPLKTPMGRSTSLTTTGSLLLAQNEHPQDAVVMSWWDYGYQIAGMADRGTLVDNNTWNNTHIATVGKAMSSTEEVAYPILRKHDVDYVLVIFGGLLGYSGDDINKFLWMVRIAQGVSTQTWLFYSDFVILPSRYGLMKSKNQITLHLRESTESMTEQVTAWKNSLMYKMSYYRFSELYGGGNALDRVRNQHIPKVGPTLDYLEEAFTTENWIVRIYKVRKEDPLGRDLKTANAFAQGKRGREEELEVGEGLLFDSKLHW
ncbi:hypothetical protein D9757_015165 [Collybiopsis confluens]|uniref:STT3/PglB/AglB core domain-containing protein n=1 Tax=Collybiopsis confluens TaxID=2823264 RepID=A0A8H5C616_9AGAR|nr:hypothetical protein D9757_015165 [Collybiopsis confluens]